VKLHSNALFAALVVALLLAVSLPVLAADDDPDFTRARLFRDGSVACSGADDTSAEGGRVLALTAPGKVHFTVKLRNASPNTTYSLAVSEEPNCTNAQSFGSKTTGPGGNTNFYGTYDTTAGEHNLLFNLVTSSPDDPQNREIATRDARITVPTGP
jgi:hypothetical protein